MAKAVRTKPALTIGSGIRLRDDMSFGGFSYFGGKFLVWLWRRPIGVGIAVVFVAACAWTGSVAFGAVLTAAVATAAWYGMLRWVSASGAGAKSSRDMLDLLRRRRQLLRAWPDACVSSGLIGSRGLAPYPALKRMRPLPDGGLRCRVYPNTAGLTVREVRKASADIGEKVKCPALFVKEVGLGVAELDFYWTDPIGHVLPLTQLPVARPGQLAYGVQADGSAASINYRRSLMVSGLSDFGKSNLIHALVADANRQSFPLRLYVSDPKEGVELKEYGRQCRCVCEHDRAAHTRSEGKKCGECGCVGYRPKRNGSLEIREYTTSAAETEKMVLRFEAAMRKRMSLMAGRRWEPSEAEPLCVLVLDEALMLQDLLLKKDSPLKRIGATGRAAGYVLWIVTQLPQKEDMGPVRDLVQQSICLATRNNSTTNVVLGDGAAQAGANCADITVPGVGFALFDGMKGPQKFRVPLVTDQDLYDIVRGGHPKGMLMPGGGRQTAVYSWWTEDGECLYVGKSVEVGTRLHHHIRNKPWVEEAARVDFTWYPSEAAALAAEKKAILELKPRENDQHNRANPNRVIRDASGKVIGRGREIAQKFRARRGERPAEARAGSERAAFAVLDEPVEGEGPPPEPTMFGASW